MNYSYNFVIHQQSQESAHSFHLVQYNSNGFFLCVFAIQNHIETWLSIYGTGANMMLMWYGYLLFLVLLLLLLFSSSLSCRYSKIVFLFTCGWFNCRACFHSLVNNNQILRKANKFSNVANATIPPICLRGPIGAGVHLENGLGPSLGPPTRTQTTEPVLECCDKRHQLYAICDNVAGPLLKYSIYSISLIEIWTDVRLFLVSFNIFSFFFSLSLSISASLWLVFFVLHQELS